MFEISCSVLFILLAVITSGVIFSRTLPKKILQTENILSRLLIYLLMGWPFLLAINTVISFFYIGPLTIALVLVIGAILLARDLYEKQDARSSFKFNVNLLNIFVFTVLAMAFTLIMLLLEFMGWPPIGDVATGHGPRAALFLLNQKIPMYPAPFLILYPPGFSALSATFASTLGAYPALAVFELAGAATATIVIGIYLISKIITKNAFIALIPVAFIFVPSPDLNMTRWVLGHLLNGTYPNLIGYLLLISLFFCTWLCHSKGGASLRRLFLLYSIFGFGLLFTYPAFLLYFGILSILPIMLDVKMRKVIYSHAKGLRLDLKHAALLFLAIITIAFIAFYRSSIIGAISSSYLANVIISYLTGSYVLGGTNIFSEYSSYTLPLSVILSDYRTAFLIISLAISIFLIAKKNSQYETSIYAALAIVFLASFIPVFSGVSWAFMSDRIMALIQLFAIAAFCRYFLSLPDVLQIRPFLSNPVILTRRLNSKITISLLLLFLMGSSAALTSIYAYERAMVWGWSSHTPYFEDDFNAIEYAAKEIPQADLIMGDGSFAAQFIMSIAIKNISCFDYYRVSRSDLYFGTERFWDNPADSDYLRQFIIENNISYVISMSEPMRITVNKQINALEYSPKPFSPEVYASILDNVPFLEKIFQSGKSNVYRVDYYEIGSKDLKP